MNRTVRTLQENPQEQEFEGSQETEAAVLQHANLMWNVALKFTDSRLRAAHLVYWVLGRAFAHPDEAEAAPSVKMWLLAELRNVFVREYGTESMRAVARRAHSP
jgi:DNA-directed RNA polymerase specialized sigma24 family protein